VQIQRLSARDAGTAIVLEEDVRVDDGSKSSVVPAVLRFCGADYD
jgi:hypothetical protein